MATQFKINDSKVVKPFRIVSFKKARLENYNAKVEQSFQTLEEAEAEYEDSYEGTDNAVKGFDIVKVEEDGSYTDPYSGEPVQFAQYN